MPLPDAPNTSPRVYTLLQNIDLENVTQANLATLGNPISVEELNEDELRRLVLVNLARLSVKSEWNGLLTAASGGGDFNAELPGTDLDATGTDYDRYQVMGFAPWGTGLTTYNTLGKEEVTFFPFLSPKDGALTEIGIQVSNDTSSPQSTFIGIYSDDGDGVPDTLLGYATFDSTNQAIQYDTSLSTTITLARGTQYWLARGQSTAENCQIVGYSNYALPNVYPVDALTEGTSPNPALMTISTHTSLPATIDADDLKPSITGNDAYRPLVTFKW